MKSTKKMIGFHFGALASPFEEQANEQGYTLGDKAEYYEKMFFGLTAAWFDGVMTDGEHTKALQRLVKRLAKAVKPIKGDKQDG